MAIHKQVPSPIKRLRRFSWFILALWTVGIAASLAWNLYEQEEKVLKIAINTARITFEKDVLYRKWGAKQGGVYVPVSDDAPPNPYLNVPNRDITASSGVDLTLVNPAYMARLVNAESGDVRSSRSHITSLKPIRPENCADPWETAALKAFEAGEKEVSSIAEMSDGEYVRFMRPFITEKSCLKCHAEQGYKEGDIRGGVSVSVPTEPLRAIERPVTVRMLLIHLMLWLVGVVGIVISKNSLIRQISSREEAEAALRTAHDELEMRVRQRTAELQESMDLVEAGHRQFQEVLDQLPSYVILLSSDYHVPFANRFFEERFGKSEGRRCYEYLFNRTEPCENCETYKVLKTGEPHHWEWTGPDGRNYDIHDFPFTDADGSPLIMEVGVDITEIKNAQTALKELNETLERRVAERTAELHASEERLRFALETIHTGAWDLNLVDRVAFRSLEHDRIFGYAELLPEWTYEMFLEQVLLEDRAMVNDRFRRAMESQSEWNFECRIRRADGQVRWIWAAGQYHQDATGFPHRMAGIVQDITAQAGRGGTARERD